MDKSNTWTRRGLLAALGTTGAAISTTGLASADQHDNPGASGEKPDNPGETVNIVFQDCFRARIVGSFPREVRAFIHFRGRRDHGGGVTSYTWVDGTLPLSVDIREMEDRTYRPIYNKELTAVTVVEFTEDGRDYLADENVPERCRGWTTT